MIGHPIGHSLSPRLHGRWLERYGIEGRYEAVDLAPDAFAGGVRRLAQDGWAGVNVTLPHKASALALADEATETASRLGVANLLIFCEGKITADNTDQAGFASALAPHLTPAHRRALVLGAGGATPAVLAALLQVGIEDIRLTNRTAATAEAMAGRFGAQVVPWADRQDALNAETDLVINATPLGLRGYAALDLPLGALPDHAVVADIAYSADGTELVRAARGRGLSGFDGLAMLVAQAVPSFAAFFGPAPDDLADAEAFLRRGA